MLTRRSEYRDAFRVTALAALAACSGGAPSSRTAAPPAHPASSIQPAIVVASASPSLAPSSGDESTRLLQADGPVALSPGTTFTAPAGWLLSTQSHRVTLVAPEHDVTLVLLDVEAADLESVLRDAWHRVDAGFAREVLHRSAPPSRDGWTETLQLTYRTAASESRVVIGLARRAGARVFVALLDGTESGLSRRGSQVQTAVDTLRPPGVGEESWVGRVPHALDAGRITALESFVRAAMDQSHTPGVAVGVVIGRSLAYTHGFGVRVLGGSESVTPHTLFMIGSITKSLTSLMMSRMIDVGRFTWDSPVVQLLPTFRLADASLTQRMQLQHTMCACTGMPRRDLEFIFEFAHASPEHWLDVLATTAPTTGLGEVFQYSNLLVAAGGFAAVRAVHPTGDLTSLVPRTLHDELFVPLGMRSTTLESRVAARAEHAEPHGRTVQDEIVHESIGIEGGIESVGPAGAAWSNVEDMARYVLVELGGGALPDGQRVVSEQALLERRRPRVRIDEHNRYGLALITNDAHGVSSVWHSGGTLGFTSDVQIHTQLGFGIIVLANAAGSSGMISVIERRLYELLLDARPEAESQLAYRRVDVPHRIAENLAHIDLTPPHDWYAPWLGTWRNAALGSVVLAERNAALVADVGEWQSRVGREHHAMGTDTLVLLDPPLAGVDIQTPRSDAPFMLLDFPQSPYRFERSLRP